MTPLVHKVTLYVPSNVQGKVIDNSEHVRKTLRFLADRFGGSTAQQAKGAWINDVGELVEEDVTLCYAYHDGSELAIDELIRAFAEGIKSALSQESVAYELDGALHLI